MNLHLETAKFCGRESAKRRVLDAAFVTTHPCATRCALPETQCSKVSPVRVDHIAAYEFSGLVAVGAVDGHGLLGGLSVGT